MSLALESKRVTHKRLARDGTLVSSLLVAATTVALLALWEGIVILFDIQPYILPTPSEILLRAWEDLSTGVILPHLKVTFLEVIGGFALAAVLGVGLGTMIALVPFLERTIYPFVLGFQTIPKIAIAPLLLIWFGFGMQSKIITAAIIAFFPILVNVVAGLKTVDGRRLLLMRALRANALETYLKVRLPSMLPYLFAGLEVGIIFAVIGAIVGEFIGSAVGLGSLIIQRQAAVDVAGVFSVLLYLSLMGIGMNLVLRTIAKRYAFWSATANPVGA
ncbi:NitT/TauT family transport system permease protein [Rhodoligotrophos appendicifer]|uniref:ABC transporter permease n=1 Tax=Rhodoligotrophos appendicifer TaxID=987056 RepID=UPI00118625D8|nr:ABC transporter permease [Rhodoligotrophos appendicifer]